MDPFPNAPAMQASTSYGQHILASSNPSSTHSSPRSFPLDLNPSSFQSAPGAHLQGNQHSQTYPIPGGPSYPSGLSMHPHRRSQHIMPTQMGQRSHSYSSYSGGAPALQVSTNTSSEHDPNERTARPGNAHTHAAFHNSLALPLPPVPDTSNSLVTPTATTAGSSGLSSMSSAGLSSAGNVSSASSINSSFADAQQQHLQQRQMEQESSDRAAQDYIAGTPGLSKGLSRPLTQVEKERLAWLDRLKYFLATAPSRWHTTDSDLNANVSLSGPSSTAFGHGVNIYPGMGLDGTYTSHPTQHAPSHPQLNRFMLPSQEFVTCVLWNGLYHITGTDIVRALVFRFEAFGRPVRNMKKFEEGVFSDLRNLKPGVDACLEEPKSSFLDLLFKYQCIRTQKKQKVFYWFSVPHDRLFLDALDRDLKREKMGQEPTTMVVGEPALSFTYDSKRPLYEQFSKALGARDGESEFERNVRNAVKDSNVADDEDSGMDGNMTEESENHSDMEDVMGTDDDGRPVTSSGLNEAVGKQIFGFPLLGSSSYKQRRKKPQNKQPLRQDSEDPSEERGRSGQVGEPRYGSASASRERSSRLVPRYESIRHEFGPGSEDERAQSENSLSAADYFLKQAKGELLPADGVVRKPRVSQPIGEVNVYYHEGAPPVAPPASAGPSTHVFGISQNPLTRPGHLRGRSSDQITPSSHPHRHSYHGGSLSASFGNGFDFASSAAQTSFNQTPLSSAGLTSSAPGSSGLQTQARPNQPASTQVSSTAMYEQHGADGKIKAFVCPLFSCGRLFKRMEHLKRHLRTHTMERPFTCPKCKKRFSRSDNLNQHLRTHDRTSSGAASNAASTSGEGSGAENSASTDNVTSEWTEGMDDEREGSSSHNGDHSGGESEDEDWSRYTSLGDMNYPSLGLTGVDLSRLGINAGTYAPDVQMRELEASDVQEVQGDEEGLLMVANPGAGYYPVQASALFSSGPDDFGSDASQWNRPQASPAFSTISMPSPNPGHIALRSNRNSITSSPANFLQHQPLQAHSANSSGSSNFGDDFGAAAMSAPSHKASFDHANMYGQPPMVLDDTSIGAGPIRRHRSMTPGHARNGEPIRRPGTANSNEFSTLGGTPASVGSNASGSSHRGYHPYASGYSSSSRSGSAHSSPSLHNIPLGNPSEYSSHVRSSSRSSNYGSGGVMQVNEQMKQMMSMGGSDVAMGGPPDPAVAFGDAMFRTDSPAFSQQTESPAPYSIDLPTPFGVQQQGFATNQHAATLPGQFTQQQQQQFADPFYHSHLPTL